MQSVLNDISVVWRVFSLPVLEPMTRGRLQKIVAITMSCLYASLSATMATSVVAMATASTQLRTGTGCKDEEIDGYASNIVIKSVMIFTSWIFVSLVFAASLSLHACVVLTYSLRESKGVCFYWCWFLSVCVCVCVSVCLSVTTITEKIVDGFVPNFMERFLEWKGILSLCFVTIGRGVWKYRSENSVNRRLFTFYTSSNDHTWDTESYLNWNEVVRVPTLGTGTGVPRI